MDLGDNNPTVGGGNGETRAYVVRERAQPGLKDGRKVLHMTAVVTPQISHAFGVLAAMRGKSKSSLLREMILRELREGARSAKDATVTELGEGASEGARLSEGARSSRRGARRVRAPLEAS